MKFVDLFISFVDQVLEVSFEPHILLVDFLYAI